MNGFASMQKAGGAGKPDSGIVLGPELVDDPGFDSDAAWDDEGPGAAIVGSQLLTTGAVGAVTETAPFAVTAAKTYYYELVVDTDSSGAVLCSWSIGNTAFWSKTGTGTFTGTVVAGDTTPLTGAFLTSVAVFDSVSIKEVL